MDVCRLQALTPNTPIPDLTPMFPAASEVCLIDGHKLGCKDLLRMPPNAHISHLSKFNGGVG